MTTTAHAHAHATASAATRGASWLQRKCACGSAAGLDGQCSNCGRKKMLGLQAKLAVGRSDDPLELEADRMAARVLAAGPPQPAAVRRTTSTAAGEPVPPVVDETLRGPGQPLDRATRQFMEPRFGHDFGRVRVHTGAQAERSTRAVQARAYTVGPHIVLGAGQPLQPGSALLAHELTHVVQQGAAPAVLQRQPETAPGAADLSDAEPVQDPPTAQEQKERKAETTRIQDASQQLTKTLAGARSAQQQADAMVAGAGEVDLDLVDIVKAQGESVAETIALLDELAPMLAGASEDQRRTILGFAYIEAQMYVQNAQHLHILNKNVQLDLAEVTNAEDIEEELARFAEWHEDWITQNAYVGEVAADFFGLQAGVQDEISVNQAAAEALVDFQQTLQQENEVLPKIDSEMDSFAQQIRKIRNRGRLQKIADLLRQLRGRGRGRPRRPNKARTSKPKARTNNKPAKPRKQFRKAKGQTKPKNARQRKKKDKKKSQRQGAYPICWPTLLGPPMLADVFVPFYVRSPGAERDESAAQQMRMENIRNKGPVARDMHLHHSVPLFLGGLDATPMNLTLIPKKSHLTGHSWLAHQPQMATPPRGLQPLPVNVYHHPAGTRYRFKGFKSSRTEVC